jgi:hypothetical protein
MFWDEDNDLSAYAGTDAGSTPYYFVFQDSTGKCARAYGGAIGGGEALGAELITAFTNAPGGDAFETFTTSGVDITQAINNAGGWGVGNANAVNVVGNKLYKYTCNFTLNSGTAPIVGFSHVTAGIQSSFSKTMSTGAMTWYVTPNAVYEYFCFQTATTGATDFAALSNSLKEFTDVPVTGLHLMSTRNGTTRNMKDVDSGFNPNGIVKILIYRALP